MTRLTRRAAALAWNSQAPFGAEVPVPKKRKSNPDAPKEWHLQAACVKVLRARAAYAPHLAFIAAQAENPRGPARANIAKMLGLQSGIPDLLLMRNDKPGLYVCAVELKLPGNKLSPAQEGWFEWFRGCAVTCHRCDNVADFAKILDVFLT